MVLEQTSQLDSHEALMKFMDEITTAIHNKLYTIGIFIDLKKAFDMIDHGLLMQKI